MTGISTEAGGIGVLPSVDATGNEGDGDHCQNQIREDNKPARGTRGWKKETPHAGFDADRHAMPPLARLIIF
jgi:hypothetical protein